MCLGARVICRISINERTASGLNRVRGKEIKTNVTRSKHGVTEGSKEAAEPVVEMR